MAKRKKVTKKRVSSKKADTAAYHQRKAKERKRRTGISFTRPERYEQVFGNPGESRSKARKGIETAKVRARHAKKTSARRRKK